MHGTAIVQVRKYIFLHDTAHCLFLIMIAVLAFSPNNNEIHIYDTRNWNLLWKLTEVS